MPTSCDILLLQECFKALDGVDVGAHEQFTPCRTGAGLRCPWSHRTPAMELTSGLRVEMDCSCWPICLSKARKLGDFETVLAEIQDFMHERSGLRLILDGDFNRSFPQRTSALLGRTRGQDGQLGDLRESLEMSGTSVVDSDSSTGKK